MESPVNTIRDNFYRDLILEYTGRGEQSFLYRYFWADSISGLLEEHLLKRRDNSRKLWVVFCFCVWYEIYFCGGEVYK